MKTLRLNTVTPRYFQLFSCEAGLRAYDEFFAPSQVVKKTQWRIAKIDITYRCGGSIGIALKD